MYVSLGFYAFQSEFFATTYHFCVLNIVIINFISGFGAGNILLPLKILLLYVILRPN